jgi:Fe-S-cluster containining protein
MAASPYRCPPGCGLCCETFEPDILEVEALYLAAWILKNAPERLDDIEKNAGRRGCVLADPSGEYHCTVYGGRPLICRLFAFSGDRGKDGTIRFRPCSHMAAAGRRSLGQAELIARFGALPPAMGDLASEAETLLPSSAGDRAPLREALPVAAAKIRHLTDLAAFSAFSTARNDGGGDNDNPGGNTPPLPRAG